MNNSKDFCRPLGPVSEAFYYLEYDNCRRIDFHGMAFKGKPDREALKEAYRQNLEAFPEIASRLEFRRSGLRRCLVRVPADPHPFEFVDNPPLKGSGDNLHKEALMHYFNPVLENGLDLFSEANFRWYFFTFPDDVCLLGYLGSHIGTDMANFMIIVQDLLSRYHEMVKGSPPGWKKSMVLPSERPRQVDFKWGEVIRQMRSEKKIRKAYPLVRLGKEFKPEKPTRYMRGVKLTEDETQHALKKAKAMGITFNDLLCTEMAKAVDVVMEQPEGLQSIWVVVNTRSRTNRVLETGNNAATINVDLTPEVRKDPKKLVREFVAQREKKLAAGRDVANLAMLQKLVRTMQYVPLETRKRMMRKIMERPRTLNISNMGVRWAKTVKGKVTSDSQLKYAGDLELLRFPSYFSVSYHQGQAFAAGTYRGRFALSVSAFEETIDPETAERYLNLVKEGLLA